MGIAGVKTTYNGQSYSQNRMANVIPDASFVSSAPQHAQNAFSTPTGYNTMQAMGGKSAYGDMTDARNAGAAIHKTDNSQTMVDKMQDINIGNDYQQEAIEAQKQTKN
jgi:hypothetical protein